MRTKLFNYEVDTNLNKDYELVILSDVHYYSKKNKKKLDRMLEKVKTLNPDFICMPGDTIDQHDIYDEEVLLDWLKELGKLSKVIISIGNHEYIVDFNDYNRELFSKINSIENVYVLDNDSVSFGNLSFLGITLPGSYYHKYNDTDDKKTVDYINKTIKYKKNKYNILLYHSPIDIYKKEILNNLDIKDSLDLILCGHMHGGITPNVMKPLFKGKGIFRPDGRLFANMCYGYYDNLGVKCIISSGVTKSSHTNHFEKMDFLMAPEVTVVKLVSKSVKKAQ